jgi:hypothetical protein
MYPHIHLIRYYYFHCLIRYIACAAIDFILRRAKRLIVSDFYSLVRGSSYLTSFQQTFCRRGYYLFGFKTEIFLRIRLGPALTVYFSFAESDSTSCGWSFIRLRNFARLLK